MSSLLSLPCELRDNIIDYVVASQRRNPPLALGNNDSNGAERVQFEDTYWKGIGNLIYFERSSSAFQPTFGGLLLTCRQLRAETLERASKIDIPCVLDLLIINEEKIWVTWLSMPANRFPMIEELRIHIRFQCDYNYNESAKTDKFSLIFGTQTKNLLYRISAVGCAGALPDDERRRLWLGARYKFKDTFRFEHEYIFHYSIRKLDFHLIFPLDTEAVHYTSFCETYVKELKDTLDGMASGVFVYSKNAHRPEWTFVPERIGGIVISYGDGERYNDWWDLKSAYEELASKVPDLAKYVELILAKRKENGL